VGALRKDLEALNTAAAGRSQVPEGRRGRGSPAPALEGEGGGEREAEGGKRGFRRYRRCGPACSQGSFRGPSPALRLRLCRVAAPPQMSSAAVDALQKQAGGLNGQLASALEELAVRPWVARGSRGPPRCWAHAARLVSYAVPLVVWLQAARNQLLLKDKELRAASEALGGKLQESKQYQQMKTMMQVAGGRAAARRGGLR
jgi:hypothetical protein